MTDHLQNPDLPTAHGADGDDRVGAGLAELAASIRPASARELASKLGAQRWAGLSRRQRDDFSFKLVSVRAARSLLRLTPRGQHYAVLASLSGVLYVRFGRRVGVRTLDRWRRVYRVCGPGGLVDQRGRPRGNRPVDAGLLVEFAELIGRGLGRHAAHRRVLRRAERERRPWPRTYVTVAALLKRGAAQVKPPAALPPDEANGQLREPNCN